MTPLLFALWSIGGGASSAAVPTTVSAATVADAPIRVWMNQERRFREGDHARLQVDADVEGYLLVLHYDTDGRVQVLFPLDPRDDNRVRAGRRYEVLDESGRQAFLVGGSGTGLIYSAISSDPWRFEDVSVEGRWDYVKLAIDRRSRNPEGDLTEVVQKLAGSSGFDYDVLGYRVEGDDRYGGLYPARTVYLPGDYLYCNNWYWRYDGCSRWPFDGGWSFGVGFHFGGYSPYDYWYSPYYYGYYPYGYSPYGYGYNPYRYGNGGYPYYPSRPFGGRGPVIVGRPRGYSVQPRSSLGAVPRGFGSGVSRPAARPAAPGIDWRARMPARPVREVEGRRGDGGFRGGNEAAPPARRARPEGPTYPMARGRGESGGDRGVVNRGERDEGRRGREPASPPPPRSEPSRGSSGGGTARGDGGSRPQPSHSSRPRRP